MRTRRVNPGGSKPWDAIVMFKTIILCALYNLSDDQVEHQRDRLSHAISGVGSRGPGSRAKTVWLYREQLQAGVIEARDVRATLLSGVGGQIIDASIVAVPKQRNRRGEGGWEDKPASGAKRMSRRGGPRSTARAITVTRTMSRGPLVECERRGGARQPSRRYPGWGQHGFGCVGGQRLPLGGDRGGALRSRIRKGRRNKPLSEREKQGNKTRSSVRVRASMSSGPRATTLLVVSGAGEGADRVEEPRLQHAPGPTGAAV